MTAKKPPNLKILAGTDRKDRKKAGIKLPIVEGVPDAPDWLPNVFAVNEWYRLAPILHVNKLLTDASLTALAHLCAIHGKIVQLYAAGTTPTAALIGQLRGLINDFGLTPIAQGRVKPGSGPDKPNPFDKHKKRSNPF